MTINASTRRIVRQRANHLCEYCHSSEEASTTRFTLDHRQPKSLEGSDDVDNLVLACHRCNMRRYNFTAGTDRETGCTVPLFNPRLQLWSEHFSWSADGLRIVGLTAIGRATCDRLDMNDDEHDEGSIIGARRLWIRGGWHPPQDDPILPD
ncbi:HNH endonuclease [Leptolyngbya sp. NIES-2104]|uniref:HNH endonuclease n=1 Tax=Leptolyngbya sp. NIES-2104 TaxID=1552121 RepID=UPI00073EED8E|nr:HNH endonuclease signature motif containing protein [Leptolyngbya sp. NIES-2104]